MRVRSVLNVLAMGVLAITMVVAQNRSSSQVATTPFTVAP